jgi:hypothetical protein
MATVRYAHGYPLAPNLGCIPPLRITLEYRRTAVSQLAHPTKEWASLSSLRPRYQAIYSHLELWERLSL